MRKSNQTSANKTTEERLFRKAVPDGVVERLNLGIYSVVEQKDGSLMADNGRVSRDGGKNWSEPRAFVEKRPESRGAVGTGLIRLKSEALAYSGGGLVWISCDEGRSWGQPKEAYPFTLAGPYYFGAELIQLDSGRLLYPAYVSFGGHHPELAYKDVSSYGTWRGERYQVEGHGHMPEIYVTVVAYSDDEGTTWEFARNTHGRPTALMGWFNEEGIPDGNRAVTGFGEATAAETADGRILMFARPLVNRVVRSYSSDGGESWSAVVPTSLANSISPPRLVGMPKTRDLMCVWNQVSKDEIHRGYRRGRLSVAISKDCGASWENFKTLEVSEGLEDVERIPAEYPIKMVRARDDVGELPEGWAFFHYANVSFAGDKVFISYSRGTPRLGLAEQNLHKQEKVLRIYPLQWFYD